MDNEKPEGAFRARLKQMFPWLAMVIWHVCAWLMMAIAFLMIAAVTHSMLAGIDTFGGWLVLVAVCGLFIYGVYYLFILHDTGKLETQEQLGLAIKPNYLNGAGCGIIFGLVLFSVGTLAAILNVFAVFKPNFLALLIFVICGACYGAIFMSRAPHSE